MRRCVRNQESKAARVTSLVLLTSCSYHSLLLLIDVRSPKLGIRPRRRWATIRPPICFLPLVFEAGITPLLSIRRQVSDARQMWHMVPWLQSVPVSPLQRMRQSSRSCLKAPRPGTPWRELRYPSAARLGLSQLRKKSLLCAGAFDTPKAPRAIWNRNT